MSTSPRPCPPGCCVFAALLLLASAPPGHARDAVLETAHLRFHWSGTDGSYELTDKPAGVTWRSNPSTPGFGEAVLRIQGSPRTLRLGAGELRGDANCWTATYTASDLASSPGITVSVRRTKDQRCLEFSWEPLPGTEVESVRLLDRAFWTTDSDAGCVLVPVRVGLRVPADSGKAFDHRFDTYTYEGCHMAMFGVVRQGAALLVTWDDPYTALDLHSATNTPAGLQVRQWLAPSLTLRKSARSFRVHTLGRGDENTVGLAYRDLARSKGWRVTWAEKLRKHPEGARLFGASNYKLWSTLDRQMSEDSRTEQRVNVNWTFPEAAQVAEHLRRDLELDRVLFIMGGWIHRGYDNQHPDILPTAPECGGDAAFADCCRRVQAAGYVLGLHDNYQDIYRDSLSWDERWITKNPDGTLLSGGHWAGGRAYLTCSQQALALARRPQNLAAVRRLSGPAAYFIDTTYAAGLMECFDKEHPLTRLDDMHWKQELSEYARDVFGLFGSECGREWAIPHADFFEGLTGVSGAGYHNAQLPEQLGAIQFPLFEMVFHDTIAMYGKYGYDIQRSTSYVLQHAVIGRPLHYHNVPAHLYWQRPDEGRLGLRASAPAVTPLGARRFQIRYAWQVDSPLTNSWRVFVHFTDRDGRILFQGDYTPNPPASAWTAGRREDGPFTLEVPPGITGPVDVRVGLFAPGTERARLQGRDDGENRYRVARLKIIADRVEMENPGPEPLPAGIDHALYVRADGGWAEGQHPFDRFVKNTHEILSPLHRLTAQLPLNRHEFLAPDRSVRRSVFGKGREHVEIIANTGSSDFIHRSRSGGDITLPPGGFVAESRTFTAFCATQWNTLRYASPTLFTLESTDGRDLARSRAVRVFHGFGDGHLRIRNRDCHVQRESVLKF